MSEDSNTPVLRLKPRARTEGGAAPSHDLPPPPAVTSAAIPLVSPALSSAGSTDQASATAEAPLASADGSAETAAQSLKLRPRATPATGTGDTSASVSAPASTNAQPPAFPPPIPAPAGGPAPVAAPPTLPKAEPQDAARFKLKPRLGPSDAAAATKAVLPPAPPPPAAGSAPLPLTTAIATKPASGAVSPAIPPLQVPPHASAPPSIATVKIPTAPRAPGPIGKPEAPERPENSRAFKTGLWIAGALLVLVIAVGGFLAFRTLLKKEPHGAPMFVSKPAPKRPDAKAAPEEPDAPELTKKDPVVANPQSMAGKLVGKARDTVAARESSGQVAGVDDVLSDTSTPEAAAPARPASAKPAAAATPHPTALTTPGDVAAAEKPTAPPPSLAFRTFVGNLRVNGVFQGEPGRALLNGRMVGVGEMADSQLGIRFTQIDSTRKLLTFEDKVGSVVQRRY